MEYMSKTHDFNTSSSKEGESRRILIMEKISEVNGNIKLHKKVNDIITDTFIGESKIVYDSDTKTLLIKAEKEIDRYNLNLKQTKNKLKKFFNVDSVNVLPK